jgi:hypothetical protein
MAARIGGGVAQGVCEVSCSRHKESQEEPERKNSGPSSSLFTEVPREDLEEKEEGEPLWTLLF